MSSDMHFPWLQVKVLSFIMLLMMELSIWLISFLRCSGMMPFEHLKSIRRHTYIDDCAFPAERLSDFYEVCKGVDLGRGQRFPKIEQPPPSFITAMEEYIREAPLSLIVRKDMESSTKGHAPKLPIAPPKIVKELEYKKPIDEQKPGSPPPPPPPVAVLTEPPKAEAVSCPPLVDLLETNETSQGASELDERNALALAIVPSEGFLNSQTVPDISNGATGWELALVTAPSSSGSAVAESKLAGGLDRLILDSLYDDAITKTNENGSYHMGQVAPIPFEYAPSMYDPFHASAKIMPPTGVQMAAMSYQQQLFIAQQQQPQQNMMGQQLSNNPFGNQYGGMDANFHHPHNPYTGYL